MDNNLFCPIHYVRTGYIHCIRILYLSNMVCPSLDIRTHELPLCLNIHIIGCSFSYYLVNNRSTMGFFLHLLASLYWFIPLSLLKNHHSIFTTTMPYLLSENILCYFTSFKISPLIGHLQPKLLFPICSS